MTILTPLTRIFGRLVRGKAGVVLGSLALVALLLGAALTLNGAFSARATENGQREGRDFAVAAVPGLLSYDFNTVDAHFADVLDDLGGDFRTQFEEVSREVIVPSAKKRQVVTTAEVIESSVVDAAEDHVDLLLFVNQSTTSTDSPETKLDGSRVKVTSTRDGDRWLVTAMTPV